MYKQITFYSASAEMNKTDIHYRKLRNSTESVHWPTENIERIQENGLKILFGDVSNTNNMLPDISRFLLHISPDIYPITVTDLVLVNLLIRNETHSIFGMTDL